MSSHSHTHAILGNYIRKLSKVKLKAMTKFDLAVNIPYTYTGYNKWILFEYNYEISVYFT